MRLLAFNCHEAWVHQLGALACPLDIVVGLKGRATEGWDERMRPVPPNARLVTLGDVAGGRTRYDCIVTHNLTDLIEARDLAGPRLIVLHVTLEGRAVNERRAHPPAELPSLTRLYLGLVGGHAVAVSALKRRSWGITDDVVPFGADVDAYPPWRGDVAAGLRVSNLILQRPEILLWDFHQRAFGGVPVTLVGHNPDLDGVAPARDWDHLKEVLSRHRFYIHTAAPALEDGYNMASLEAMAAGLPVLGNRHPSSPVEHGVSGFLSDDPDELRECARRLLADRELARRMGAAARATVAERFSLRLFAERFRVSIGRAKRTWRAWSYAQPGVKLRTG
jgi:glycosyltransferase involved in cell wall biosynthesis